MPYPATGWPFQIDLIAMAGVENVNQFGNIKVISERGRSNSKKQVKSNNSKPGFFTRNQVISLIQISCT